VWATPAADSESQVSLLCHCMQYYIIIYLQCCYYCLQCFDTVGWVRRTCNHNHNFRKLEARDLDLGSGQGHINMHNTCRTASVPNHLTVAWRTTEIWPFEFHEIPTFDEVWTLVIAFLEGNSKIGLWQAVDQIPYYHYQPSVLSSTQKWWRR